MAESAEKVFVARESDIAWLRERFESASAGKAVAVSLQAPIGGGKRALVGELARSLTAATEDVLIWRTAFIDEEDGMRALLRLYASLYAALHRDTFLKGKVEMILNAQLPQHPKRVQQWFQAFIDGLKRGGPKPGEESFQVSLPRDNPLIGLTEIVSAIAGKLPIVADLQNAQSSHSISVHAFVEALMAKAADKRLLVVIGTEALSDTSRAFFPMPLVDLLDRRAELFDTLMLAPWGETEVASYLASKGLEGNAAAIARVGQGRPGYVAELIDQLETDGKLGDALEGVSLATLYPQNLDETELEDAAPAAEGARKHAGAGDLDAVAWRAALLGRAFPSGLVADIGGFERESVDDLLDAAGDLFKELQFSKPLQTWIYQFSRAIWRQGVWDAHMVDEARREESLKTGLQTANFMERFLVPRGYDFIPKTSRLYAELGEMRRAALLRSMALSSERPEVWGMTQDLIKYATDVPWPDPMRRTVYMNLLDRMVQMGDVNQTEGLYNEAMAWAQEKEDRTMQAWLLFAGARLDLRRQDHYRSRDRAKDALTLYEALEDKVKTAEIQNHLAMVELSDGNPTAALEHVANAIKIGQVETPEGPRVLPQIAANGEFVRGLVKKRERKFKEAAEHFRIANEISGASQQAGLALESGLNYGESLLLAQETAKAADVLERVLNIARGLRNPVRERAASSLLSQAHGGLKNFEAALKWANHTLELSKQLKFERLLPVDTYNVGFFHLMMDKPTEALALFRQARSSANLQQDVMFTKELLYNTGVAAQRIGEAAVAKEAFSSALPAAEQSKDFRKVVGACQQLANLEAAGGNKAEASKLLQQALAATETGGLKEERRNVKRQLEELRG